MKKLRRILSGVAIAIAAVLLFLQFGLGTAVKHGAQTVGSALLGCDVAIDGCHVRLLTGVVDMRGVVVGPPEGFDANLFELGRLRVDFSPRSLFGDGPFLIREIAVTNALVSYELKGLDSNISAVLDKLGAGGEGTEGTEGTKETEGTEETPEAAETEKAAEAEETAEAEEETVQEGKGVVIEHFVFSGAEVRAAFWDGKGIKPTLPTIELTDIGKSSGGATAAEAVGSVFASIGRGVIGLVADLGGAVVDAAAGAAGAVADVAGDAADAVGDKLGDAADAVGDKLGDAADVVGDKLGDATDAVGDAIGGLFGD